jgi:hypothetical protein
MPGLETAFAWGRDSCCPGAASASPSIGLPQLEHCTCVERTGQRHFAQTPTMGLRACRSAWQCAHRARALGFVAPQAGHSIVGGILTPLDFFPPQAFPGDAGPQGRHEEVGIQLQQASLRGRVFPRFAAKTIMTAEVGCNVCKRQESEVIWLSAGVGGFSCAGSATGTRDSAELRGAAIKREGRQQ